MDAAVMPARYPLALPVRLMDDYVAQLRRLAAQGDQEAAARLEALLGQASGA